MGNICDCLSQNAKDNFLFFQKKSSNNAYISGNEWVRQLQQSSSERLILDHSTFQDKNTFYYLITHPTNPNLGVIYTAKCFYEGQIKDRMAHGQGRESFSESGMYSGSFFKNVRHGDGQYEDLQISFRGNWNYGCPKSGTLITRQRKIYVIEDIKFTDRSMKEASIKMTLPDQSVFKGQIMRNTQNQYFYQYSLVKGILTMPNKDYFDGEFMNGKFHDGKYQWVNGKKYIGGFKQGLKDDEKGKFYYRQNQYIVGKWQKGVKVGRFDNFACQKQKECLLGTIQFKDGRMIHVWSQIDLRQSPEQITKSNPIKKKESQMHDQSQMSTNSQSNSNKN